MGFQEGRSTGLDRGMDVSKGDIAIWLHREEFLTRAGMDVLRLTI
jgi:hypothetical protein